MIRCISLVLMVGLVFAIGCGGSEAELTPQSRAAFLGTWHGNYSGIDDEMIIEPGPGENDVVITIHNTFTDPDTVNGVLVAGDRIEVPEQSLGGHPGTAVITLVDGKLQLEQSGLGMTVNGTDYVKQ